MYLPFIQLFKPRDPVHKVANVRDHNRLANIVNDIRGIGCRIVKNTNGEGRGWFVICGDGSSDIDTMDIDRDFVPPNGYDTRENKKQLGGGYDSRGINKTFESLSLSSSHDETIDDTRDYRGRIIECAVKQVPAGDSAALTADSDWKTTIVAPSISSAVTVASDSPYSVTVETDGSLHCKASAADTDYAIIWIRTSAPFGVPASCPYTFGDTTPATVTVANARSSIHSGGTILGEVFSDGLGEWAEYRIKNASTNLTATAHCTWSKSQTTVEKTCSGAAATDTVTCAGHGLTDGDWVNFAFTTGSPTWPQVYYRVANATTDTFQLNTDTFGGGTSILDIDDDFTGTVYGSLLSECFIQARGESYLTWVDVPGSISLTLPSGWNISFYAVGPNDASPTIDVEKTVGGDAYGTYSENSTDSATYQADATVTEA